MVPAGLPQGIPARPGRIGIETARALAGLRASGMFTYKTIEQGAATSVLVATSPLLVSVGGRYFEDCNEAGLNEPGSRRGVAAYALDASDAALIWQVSVDTLASAQLA